MAQGDITWFVPESGKKNSLNKIVSYMPQVEKAIQVACVKIALDATSQLAKHSKTGAAEVEIARHPRYGTGPDWYVYLRDADPGGEGKAGKNKFDRSAMSIEFGWTQTHAFGEKLAEPIEHPGLNILGGAMDRAAKRYRGPR